MLGDRLMPAWAGHGTLATSVDLVDRLLGAGETSAEDKRLSAELSC